MPIPRRKFGLVLTLEPWSVPSITTSMSEPRIWMTPSCWGSRMKRSVGTRVQSVRTSMSSRSIVIRSAGESSLTVDDGVVSQPDVRAVSTTPTIACLLYTSDAADE